MDRDNLLKERHGKLLEFQEEIKPFTPTVQEIGKVWGLAGNAPTVHVLRKMFKRGMVVCRTHGRKSSYYAVEVNYG